MNSTNDSASKTSGKAKGSTTVTPAAKSSSTPKSTSTSKSKAPTFLEIIQKNLPGGSSAVPTAPNKGDNKTIEDTEEEVGEQSDSVVSERKRAGPPDDDEEDHYRKRRRSIEEFNGFWDIYAQYLEEHGGDPTWFDVLKHPDLVRSACLSRMEDFRISKQDLKEARLSWDNHEQWLRDTPVELLEEKFLAIAKSGGVEEPTPPPPAPMVAPSASFILGDQLPMLEDVTNIKGVSKWCDAVEACAKYKD
jgi:hypothetical protein